MEIDVVTAALAPLLSRLRGDEPLARGFFLFGSLARGEQAPFSDIDVRVVTDGAPRAAARMTVIDVDGRATHVSIGARGLDELAAFAGTAAGWPWVAGFLEVAVTLHDPSDAVRTRLHSAVAQGQPARLASESGLHSDLEDMIEHLAKTGNAHAQQDHARTLRHAALVAVNARRALVPVGPVAPARRGGQTEERALATMPPGFADDVALAAGEVTHARAPPEVVAACSRIARAVVARLEALPEPELHDPLRADLLHGRVRALVERLTP